MTDAPQKEAREVKRYELGVHCSQLCLGGRAILTETTDPDPFLEDVVMATDYDALLVRYDDAIRLLRECAEWSGKEDVPGLGWIDCQIDRDTIKEALAFLAAEPTKKGSEE